jgi:hypothetical protein
MILPSFFLSIYRLTNNTYYDILSTKKEVKNSWQRFHQRKMGIDMDQFANAPLPEARRRMPIMA